MLGFWPSDLVLVAVQAAVVALPGAGVPPRLARFAGRWWALVLPLSLGLVVAAIALASVVADALALLAAVAVPPLAAAALGWGMRGARAWLALVAVVLLALAWWRDGTLLGEACAVALTALSCVTLGRLLAAAAPLRWLEAGIIAMALLDCALVFGQQLQAPNATLNAAVAAGGYPRLHVAGLGDAAMGYGDLFAAGVLGAIVAACGQSPSRVALLVLACAGLWDLLFLVRDDLPATVPVAVALVLWRATWGREAAARAVPAARLNPP